MPKRIQPDEPDQLPKPEKFPEVAPPEEPEEPMIPEEEPDMIPDEEPYTEPPAEVPAPDKGL